MDVNIINAADCTNTSVGLQSIEDLGPNLYIGRQGGLYPNGLNTPPLEYTTRGQQIGQSIVPINNKIGLIATGMSNANQSFAGFIQQSNIESNKNPSVVFVNAADGGADIDKWLSSKQWRNAERDVRNAGLTNTQIQAMWFFHGDPTQSQSDPNILTSKFIQVILLAESKFPNLKQVHIASMSYMGYNLSEPWLGYDGQWAAKWTIEKSVLNTFPGRSWIGWNFQQWTDGAVGRTYDDYRWLCSDTASDGRHLSPQGQVKVGQRILNYYMSALETTWFRK